MTGAIDAALFTKISAASTWPGGVHRRTAPDSTDYPLATFGLVSLVDEYVHAGRAWVDCLYDVTTWDKNTSAVAVRQKADAVDAALTDGALSLDSGSLAYLRRVGRLEDDPTENGVRYQRVTDTFRLRVRPA